MLSYHETIRLLDCEIIRLVAYYIIILLNDCIDIFVYAYIPIL